jgi:Protein of unknown function (DUF4242)
VPTYLVERYWPGVTSGMLQTAFAASRGVLDQLRDEGSPIREISCILIPEEEVVFSVYEGISAAAVLQFNERADIPVSRIVEAILL